MQLTLVSKNTLRRDRVLWLVPVTTSTPVDLGREAFSFEPCAFMDGFRADWLPNPYPSMHGHHIIKKGKLTLGHRNGGVLIVWNTSQLTCQREAAYTSFRHDVLSEQAWVTVIMPDAECIF